jgi:hypothetical protein
MVTRKRYTLGRSGAEYDAIGVGAIALSDTVATIPTTITPAPVPVSQPEIVQIAQAQAATNAPHYLGRYYASHPSSYNNGDWWLVYDTDDSPIQRGVYYSNNGAATRITTSSSADLQGKLVAALADIAWAEASGYGKASNYGGFDAFFTALGAVSAFVQNLFVGSASIIVSAGNNIVNSSNSTTSNSSASYITATWAIAGASAAVYIIVPVSGVIRVKWQLSIKDSSYTAYARLNKNYTPISEQTTTSTTFVDMYYDTPVIAGDILYLEVKSSSSSTATIANLKLCIAEQPGISKFLRWV